MALLQGLFEGALLLCRSACMWKREWGVLRLPGGGASDRGWSAVTYGKVREGKA